jgi:pyridoxine kinase
MVEALEANGWLSDIDAVMSGYMPSAEHVALTASTVELVKQSNSNLTYLCDPILGDDPGGLYVDEAVASAVRDELVPLSQIATPNRFELEWLSGVSSKRAKTARGPAKALGPDAVLVTSLTGLEPKSLTNLLTCGKEAWQTSVPKRKNAPHGVGDLMAALFLGHLLNGLSEQDALGRATGGVEAALEASKGADELRLAASEGWVDAGPWRVEGLGK